MITDDGNVAPVAGSDSGHCSPPDVGQVVRLRTRAYLVEHIEKGGTGATIVRLACLDDDAQGQHVEVVWELELDTEILDETAWTSLGRRGFDDPRFFSAYVRTLDGTASLQPIRGFSNRHFAPGYVLTPTNWNRCERRFCSLGLTCLSPMMLASERLSKQV